MADIKQDWKDTSETGGSPVAGVSRMSAADYNLHAARTNENTHAIEAGPAAPVHAAPAKTTPVPGDELALLDSAAAYALRRTTIAQLTTIILAALSAGAPATLDTIDEIAAALGDDPNAINTILTSLAGKLDKITSGSNNTVYAIDNSGNQIQRGVSSVSLTVNTLALRGSGGVTAVGPAASQNDAVNKQLLDNVIHNVRVCTTSALTFTIAAGSVTSITGLVVDGVTCVVGDDILIRDAPSATGVGSTGSSQPANGMYSVTSVAGGNLAVSRSVEIASAGPYGHMFKVAEGSSAANRVYETSTPNTAAAYTQGTTPVSFGDMLATWNMALTVGGVNRSIRGAGVSSAATYTINVDSIDYWRSLVQAVNVTGITIAGSPFNGHTLIMDWADTGTARTLTRGASFISGTAPMAPSTVVGSVIREVYRYNQNNAKYECIESTVMGGPRTKVTEYSNATSTTQNNNTIPLPPGAVGVRLTMIPGGAPGGSGRRGAAGTFRSGGGSGAAMPCVREMYIAIPSGATTYSASLGGVGVGGAAATTDNTDGNQGTAAGGNTFTCGTIVISTSSTSLANGNAGGSVGGALGGSSSILPANNVVFPAFVIGGNAGGTATGLGQDGQDAWDPFHASGAGGGGSITAANVAGNGGAGGRQRSSVAGSTPVAGGIVDGAAPVPGVAANQSALPGQGGGGGAASITAAAQAGADGVGYGAPGGGGGASLNGFNSGRGGNGGPAYTRLEWVYA